MKSNTKQLANENELDEITMIYKIKKGEKKVKILDERFCLANYQKSNIIYNDQEYPLESYFFIEDSKNEILNIKLKGITNITWICEMFKNCSSLISLPDISKMQIKTDNMSGIFSGCTSLNHLDANISKWDTILVKDMSFMFYSCSSLTKIPDISQWDTINVINFGGMFSK